MKTLPEVGEHSAQPNSDRLAPSLYSAAYSGRGSDFSLGRSVDTTHASLPNLEVSQGSADDGHFWQHPFQSIEHRIESMFSWASLFHKSPILSGSFNPLLSSISGPSYIGHSMFEGLLN